MKLSELEAREVRLDLLVGVRQVALPAALAASTPRNASVGRIGQSRLSASSFASTRSLMNLPAVVLDLDATLPEQIAVESARASRRAPRRSGRMRAPGGSEVSLSEASESSSAHRLGRRSPEARGVVERALRAAIVALAAQLDARGCRATRFVISARAAARVGSSPRPALASARLGRQAARLVALSSPSTHTSTPARLDDQEGAREHAREPTARVSVASAAMFTASVSVL